MQHAIPDVALRANKSERLPCVLVVDGSASMAASGAIDHLRDGLAMLARELKANDDTADTVQLAIVRFGDDNQVTELTPFTDASEFEPPAIAANGLTPLGKAVDHAMSMIEDQKQRYRQNGIAYKRPWLWIMSDGAPTDAWKPVAERARAAQVDKRFVGWAVGIGNEAPLDALKAFTNGERCFRLGERDLKVMFEFLSTSMSAASKGAAGTQVALPMPDRLMVPV